MRCCRLAGTISCDTCPGLSRAGSPTTALPVYLMAKCSHCYCIVVPSTTASVTEHSACCRCVDKIAQCNNSWGFIITYS